MKYTQIEDEILQKVRQQMKLNGTDYGIDVKFVKIMKIGLPESVTQNVFDRMSAERDTYIAQIRSSGEEEATKIKSKADSTASELISDADAKALIIRGIGEEQMMKSLEVLQQNPELATFNMKITALEELLNGRSTLILDQSTSPLDLLQPIPSQASNSPERRTP